MTYYTIWIPENLWGLRIHSRILKELAEVFAKSLSNICYQSWLTRKVPDDWRLANVMPIYRKSRKEDPGNYRPVSLASVPEKIREITWTAITLHIQDKQVVRPIQNKFTEGRPRLTNLLSFCDKMTHFRDGGQVVDVAYLDSSKAFNTVSHSLLL